MDAKLLSEISTEQAIALLKKIVAPSCALDQFKHFDLTLVSSSDRAKYEAALKVVAHAIKNNEITQAQFEKAVTFKD